MVPNKTFVTGPDTFSDDSRSCTEAEASQNLDKRRIMSYLTEKMTVKEVDEKIMEFWQMELPSKANSRWKLYLLMLIVIVVIIFSTVVSIILTWKSNSRNITANSENQELQQYSNCAQLDQSLLSLYYTTGGNKWRSNNWLDSEYECNWFGVTCDSDLSNIIGLDLYNNNLIGSISGEIGKWTNWWF